MLEAMTEIQVQPKKRNNFKRFENRWVIDGKKCRWPFMQFGYYFLTPSFNSEGGKPKFLQMEPM